MPQFKKYKLNELVAKANTGLDAIKRAPIVPHDTGIKCLRIQDVSQSKDFKNWGFTEVTKENYERFSLKKEEIILARTGNTIGVNIFIDKDVKSVFNNGLIRLRTNKEKCHPKFLYYNMQTSNYWSHINSIAFGTSTQPNMQIGSFLEYEIEIPDLPTQTLIASILSSLDDKIELNRRNNQTLEQIALTLFKKYFVDDIDIENLPEGWRLSSLDKVADYLNGIALQKYRPKDEYNYLPVVKIKEMKNGISPSTEKASTEIPKQYIIVDGDILFSWSGSLEVEIWCNGNGALNQHLFKVSSKLYPKWFYYYWTKQHLQDFKNTAASKATTMGHIQRHHLAEAGVLIPPVAQLEYLNNLMEPLLNKIILNRIENRNLEKTRDLLLPKLMSGEIEVNTIEKELAEA